ncbi:MAG: hypothetical protein IIC51_11870, partial [Planctomycetes bacterium]|nr:hypothetical protein [Planctomycetota bacterium]
VDPTIWRQGPDKREYYYGNLDNNRLALVKGYNMTFRTKRGRKEQGFLQTGTYVWHLGGGPRHVTFEYELRGVKRDAPASHD